MLFGAALTSPGCSRRTPPRFVGQSPLLTSDNPQAEAELREARTFAEQGDIEQAATRYEAFLAMRSDDPLAAIARLELGRIRLDAGDLDAALTLFEQVADHTDVALAEHARFNLGLTLHAAQEYESAVRFLSPFVGRTIDPVETAKLLWSLPDALVKLERHMDALTVLHRAEDAPLAEQDRERVRARVAKLVHHEAGGDQIQRAYRELEHRGEVWGQVARRALRDADAMGDLTRVRAVLAELEHRGFELDDELQAVAARAERATDVDMRSVGVILTLSGRARELGQLALHGIMLAAGLPPRGPLPANAPVVVFRDDGGDPARATAAVDELARMHRVAAIIGPIDARAAEAAAKRAHELGVPMITLSQAPRLTQTGPMIFRLFATPQGEVEQLLRFARARGYTRFAVMYPASGYGEVMASAFALGVRSAGGELVARIDYPPEATSFGTLVGELRGQRFDALFLPDTAHRLALIAPALAAAGLWPTAPGNAAPKGARSVQLLAPSVGFDHELARTTSRYLQGSVFSTLFDPRTGAAAAQAFAARFRTQFGVPANAFAAFAYDAFQFIRSAVKDGAGTRFALRQHLTTLRARAAAGPSPGFDDNREPSRASYLVQLRGQHFTRLNPPYR